MRDHAKRRLLFYFSYLTGLIMQYSRLAGLALAGVTSLSGCAAMDSALNHGDLSVQTHMSETVFLDPVPPSAKTIYVSARNTSDHPEVDIRGPLTQAISARGYQVVSDPNRAHYMLQVNILQIGPIQANDQSRLLEASYGEPLLGAGAGAALGSVLSHGNGGAALGAGLAIGVATFAANQMFKDVSFAATTDIQLSERPMKGAKVYQHTGSVSAQENRSAHVELIDSGPFSAAATGGSTYNGRFKAQSTNEISKFKQYQIRNVAYADKMNLRFEEASPILISKLTSSLSNLFE